MKVLPFEVVGRVTWIPSSGASVSLLWEVHIDEWISAESINTDWTGSITSLASGREIPPVEKECFLAHSRLTFLFTDLYHF